MSEIVISIITSLITTLIIMRLVEPKKKKEINPLVESLSDYKPLEEYKARPPARTPRTADDNAVKADRIRSKENGRDKDSL